MTTGPCFKGERECKLVKGLEYFLRNENIKGVEERENMAAGEISLE